LLRDGKHRANVAIAWLNAQGVECSVDVDRPAGTIDDSRRQKIGDARAHVLRTRRWRRRAASNDDKDRTGEREDESAREIA